MSQTRRLAVILSTRVTVIQSTAYCGMDEPFWVEAVEKRVMRGWRRVGFLAVMVEVRVDTGSAV